MQVGVEVLVGLGGVSGGWSVPFPGSGNRRDSPNTWPRLSRPHQHKTRDWTNPSFLPATNSTVGEQIGFDILLSEPGRRPEVLSARERGPCLLHGLDH